MRSVVMFLALVLAAPVLAAAPASPQVLDDCDRLAANPPDPDRVTVGVERPDVDLPKAIAACKAAVAAHPDVPRFSYQLGRVLFYDNQVDPALKSFNRAAELNYRQAKFMVGMLMTRKYAGVPQDDCRVAQLWIAAAKQQHFNAAVSYVRDRLHGRFKGCAVQATKEDMQTFLKESAGRAGYLGDFLVEDLQAQLMTWKG